MRPTSFLFFLPSLIFLLFRLLPLLFSLIRCFTVLFLLLLLLHLLLLQIDANCDENVDWDEYLGYMLLEFQEKDIMQSMSVTQPFPKPKIYVRYIK